MGDSSLVTKIIGTGRAVPENIMTNADFEKIVDTTDEWITTRSGIKQRHIMKPGEALSDYAAQASMKAIEEAGIDPLDIDIILVGTVTGDSIFPSTANYVQAKIGAKNAASMDLSAACSGWLYGIHIADSMIKTGAAKTALVIGAEGLSSITNYEDRATCVLFGDGAGAAVLQAAEAGNGGVKSTYIGSDGTLAHLLYAPGGGTILPAKDDSIPGEEFCTHMEGREVFKYAVRAMEDSALEALKRAGMNKSDISVLIPHQANIRIIDAIAKRLKVPQEKLIVNIHNYGNTSAASIPIAFDEAKEQGKIKHGDVVLCVAFGGGFTWASAVIQY